MEPASTSFRFLAATMWAKGLRGGYAIWRIALFVLFLSPAYVRGQGVEIRSATGEGSLAIEAAGVSDLSGITWIEGDIFAAVSDKRSVIQYLTLRVDRETGAIVEGALGKAVEFKGAASDLEGIVWVAAEKAFYVSAEKPCAVLKVPAGASTASRVAVPGIFAKARPNLGLESLTWNATVRQFWTANEEALAPDGPVSSPEAGTLVRLQKLNARFQPVAQYAWRTEPASFRYGSAGSGVSDLCLLPSGELIVLERGFGVGGLHVRLFLADFRGATPVAKVEALAGEEIVPAKKRLLFEEATGFTNYEGITLGPELAEGWRSLILVADSNGTPVHRFRALRIRWDAAKADAPRRTKGGAPSH